MANAVDKEQIEMLSRWWNTYGKGIVIAILVALVLSLGWRYWVQSKENHRAKASLIYQALLSSAMVKKPSEMSLQLTELKTKFADTPYAGLGALLMARFDVEAKKYSEALTQLNWVIYSTNLNEFRQLARLGAAQILLEQKQWLQAQQMLQTVDDKTYQSLVDNLLGQIFMAQNEPEKARQAFVKAKAGFQQAGLSTSVIDMELNTVNF
ncbi:MAG: hypothetical protein A3F10_01045 [Coxiella sp. RIFCSPHIGHO2_12_FULL_42_15]|nr:MAG: hypothetical protein A3F10_01045 [Coxiella sp. RIFCSPHIGHO2_12_FULL_42_15]